MAPFSILIALVVSAICVAGETRILCGNSGHREKQRQTERHRETGAGRGSTGMVGLRPLCDVLSLDLKTSCVLVLHDNSSSSEGRNKTLTHSLVELSGNGHPGSLLSLTLIQMNLTCFVIFDACDCPQTWTW